jgi:hypothetical protein
MHVHVDDPVQLSEAGSGAEGKQQGGSHRYEAYHNVRAGLRTSGRKPVSSPMAGRKAQTW